MLVRGKGFDIILLCCSARFFVCLAMFRWQYRSFYLIVMLKDIIEVLLLRYIKKG